MKYLIILISILYFHPIDSISQNKSQFKDIVDSLNFYRTQKNLIAYNHNENLDSLCRLRLNTVISHVDSIRAIDGTKSRVNLNHGFIGDCERFETYNLHKDSILKTTSEYVGYVKVSKRIDYLKDLFILYHFTEDAWLDILYSDKKDQIASAIKIKDGYIYYIILTSKIEKR